MLFSAIFLNLLLAVSAFATPSAKERFAARGARRGATRSSRPKVTNATHTDYSYNWAGAVQNDPANTWRAVTGTFIVPSVSAPAGESFAAASAWVGIDGDTCINAILQTGLDFIVEDGYIYYDAWFEWYPDYAYDFSGISFAAGDSVTVTVTATSTTTGVAQITNNSNGQSVSAAISSPYALCQQDAEWIVEDFVEGGEYVPLANFGAVTFTNAVATSTTYGLAGPGYSTVFDIEQNGVVYTAVTVAYGDVFITYQ